MDEEKDNAFSECCYEKGDIVHPKGQASNAGVFISSTEVGGDSN